MMSASQTNTATGIRPEIARWLASVPPFPQSTDVVSDPALLTAVRTSLEQSDAKLEFPKNVCRHEVDLPNGTQASIFRSSSSSNDAPDTRHRGRQRPTVFLIHGGAFVSGHRSMMSCTAATLVKELDYTCITLGYRLAPEHPFPAGLKDIVSSIEYFALEAASSFNVEPQNIALHGQSAGADLAILAAVHLNQKYAPTEDEAKLKIKSLVLSSPCFPRLDGSETRPVETESRACDWCWNPASHATALNAYHETNLAKQQEETEQTFSYIHASQIPRETLGELLPPTHVFIAECDRFYAEGMQLVHRLRQEGVSTSVEIRRGGIHCILDIFIDHPSAKASLFNLLEHYKDTLGTYQATEKEVLPEVPKPSGPIPQFPIDIDDGTVTDIVKKYNAQTADVRLKRIMDVAVQHLHDFAREVRLSTAEWMAGIEFLTKTGQTCSDIRQEFILLSDILGMSVLVDSLNNPTPSGATPSTVLGPFFTTDAPDVPHGGSIVSNSKVEEGTPMLVRGKVVNLKGKPIPNAKIETWETDASGHYDTQYSTREKADCRGRLRTDEQGRYHFRGIVPVSYPIPSDGPVGQLLKRLGRHVFRPAHLHVMIEAAGYPTLVTALYPKDDKFLHSDAVFGVKSDLVFDVVTVHDDGEAVKAGFKKSPFVVIEWDFVLVES